MMISRFSEPKIMEILKQTDLGQKPAYLAIELS